MPYHSLRDFIADLEKRNLLKRVTAPVSPVLEMTEIGCRLIREAGPAVLFETVDGGRWTGGEKSQPPTATRHPIPVLINLFGTKERVALGMGRKPEELRALGETLAALRQPDVPEGLRAKLGMASELYKTAMSMKPKVTSKAPCQEIVLTGNDIDLNLLPIQTCWPGEPAPLITWPLVVTKSSDKARSADRASPEPRLMADAAASAGDNYNLGIYRMQVLNKTQTLMRWLKHRGGAQHHAQWKELSREPLPAAIVLGCDPATMLAAVTPVPESMSEYQFSGLLRGERVELVECKTVPLHVPANAEIVLEGHVSLTDYRGEGPYGDHTGYYNSVEPFPVFTLSAITMRQNPIYVSTYTGRPPDEPSVLGEALNEIFIPLLQQQFPEIMDFYLPPEGCSYRIAVVSIKKAYPGHAKRVMMGVWSYLRQFLYTKWVIVVDDDINARDWNDVMWAISTRMDPARDITLIEHTPIDYLDFASPESGLGSKIGLDATGKWPPETHREWGKILKMDDEIVQKVARRWEEYGFG